uniref:Uncharacterized protein n=1 Tax=Glossina pallidipes TaxID=7398 RepID=A0A1A9ZLG3_GLOPL
MYSSLPALPDYNGFVCFLLLFYPHVSKVNRKVKSGVFIVILEQEKDKFHFEAPFIIPINPSNISALVRKIAFSGNSNGGDALPLPGNSIVYAIGTCFTEKAQSLLPPENISKTTRHTQHITTVSTVVSSMIPPIQSVSKGIGYIHQFSITFRGHSRMGPWCKYSLRGVDFAQCGIKSPVEKSSFWVAKKSKVNINKILPAPKSLTENVSTAATAISCPNLKKKLKMNQNITFQVYGSIFYAGREQIVCSSRNRIVELNATLRLSEGFQRRSQQASETLH